MRKLTWTGIFSLIFLTANSQAVNDSVFILPDTARPFTLEAFYRLILKYHPVAKQARLLPEVARQEIRLARGSFDPKLEAEYLLKHYNKTEYYRLFDGSVKLPTRSPVTPTVGLERNTGERLNREHYISGEHDFTQIYAGFSIPLGQGLMTDKRRTALRQSEIFSDMMDVEQINVINELLLKAAKDYWDWYHSYYNFRLAANTAQIAEEILRRTKANFEGGEAASIDTVQARITFQERQVSRMESLTDWRNNTIRISTYLWDSLMNPVELSPAHVPVREMEVTVLPETSLEELVNQARVNHPDIRKLGFELQQMELERRLVSEFMKPRFNVSYYLLNQPFYVHGFNSEFTFNDNYKFGFDLSIPLFLRKERAKVAQIKVKLAARRYDRELARRQIINEVNIAYRLLLNNGVVLQEQQAMVANYYSLMNAELINLQHGESDLFKINLQQEKLFNAESKLIRIMADYEKQKATLYWSAGVRPLP